jgi:hypothetical protein
MRTKDSGFGRPRHENFDYPANSVTARVRRRLRRRGVNRTQLSRHCDRDPHNDAGPVNNDDHNDNHNVRVAVIHSPGTTQPAVATVVGTVAAVLSPRTAARSAQTAGAVALLALHSVATGSAATLPASERQSERRRQDVPATVAARRASGHMPPTSRAPRIRRPSDACANQVRSHPPVVRGRSAEEDDR